MSPLVTRPSLPEPGTVAASIPLSAEILRTDGGSGGWWRRSGSRGLGGRGSRLGGGSGRAIIDLSEQRADRDGLTVLGRDLAERAGGRCRHLDGDLVGLKLDQRLVHRNGIAGLLEPAADGGLGHGFAERRNANFSHWCFLLRHGRAAIHALNRFSKSKTWMPATSAGMTSSVIASSAPRRAEP